MPQVTHYFITNRRVYTRGEKEYINESGNEPAGQDLRFGEMTFDPEKAITGVEGRHYELYPEPSFLEGEDDPLDLMDTHGGFDYRDVEEFGSTELYTRLHHRALEKGEHTHHILIFVHGYKSDLTTAFETIRHLHNLYVANEESPIEKIVLFTWPSMKKLLEYRDDAQDAIASGYALARAFRKLQRFFSGIARKIHKGEKKRFCNQKIHLMCHSMGNRVLEAMVAQLKKSNARMTSVFGEIFLIAADVDYHALAAPPCWS
jgi:hypothetical protein